MRPMYYGTPRWQHKFSIHSEMLSQNCNTKYFSKAKEHEAQWQLSASYSLTCTPGHVATQSDFHGNCATATVDIVVLFMSEHNIFMSSDVILTLSSYAHNLEYK